jgi:hypothetical protein
MSVQYRKNDISMSLAIKWQDYRPRKKRTESVKLCPGSEKILDNPQQEAK